MSEVHDPELFDALRRIFPTREELRSLVDYQQQLYKSLETLNNNHRAVHEHVRSLTDSHNRNMGETDDLLRARQQITDTIRALDVSHRQTREDIRRAIEALTFIQQEIRKVNRLEDRIEKLEQEVQKLWQDDQRDDRTTDNQERRLRSLEQKR